MSEVPTLENEARSKASHDLPERSTKYLAGVGLFRVVQKLIPTTRATTKTPYKALSSTVNPQEYEKKDTQRAWPTEPRRIKRWTTFTYMTLFCDLVMTLLPVIFLVLGASALSLDNKRLSPFGANIEKGIAFGPTVFPIVFAAVVARLMKGVALRCAERGTHLGLLEQLTGSQSLATAVERTVLLRRFDIIGTIVILLWLLSPLGGQSSLRILGVKNSSIASQGQIYYFNTTPIGYGTPSVFSTGDDYWSFLVTAVLEASLLESDSVLNSPVDQWNNVKIPRLDELSPFTDAAPGNPWIIVNQSHKTWSSLTGLMIHQLPPDGFSTFTLESTYLDISCANRTHFELGVNFSRKDSYLELYRQAFGSELRFHNLSSPFYGPVRGISEDQLNSCLLDSSSDVFSAESAPVLEYMNTPLNLIYASLLEDSTSIDLFNCSMGTARVESGISCHGSSCAVNRMRRSEIYTQSRFSMPFNKVEFQNTITFLPFAMGVPHPGTVSSLDLYLLGNNKPLSAGSTPIATDFSGVTAHVFSERLTTMFNTVWQASLAPGSIPLGDKANFSAATSTEESFPEGSRTTSITREVSVYAANHLFIGILLATALILQLCAISGLILKYTATAPDVLGYISTMTMESPHINVPRGGNTLDGLERARYLKNVKVQLADVNWDQVEGHLAFRTVDNEMDFARGKLSTNRLYV